MEIENIIDWKSVENSEQMLKISSFFIANHDFQKSHISIHQYDKNTKIETFDL